MSIPVTAVSAALLGVMLAGLAARISQLRVRHKVQWGDGGNQELLRTVRAHGNTAEHAPIFLLLALAYELSAGSSVFLMIGCGAFVAARVLFVAGLLGRGLHVLRMVGALFTYFLQAALSLALLWTVLAG